MDGAPLAPPAADVAVANHEAADARVLIGKNDLD
jgi:hypothetical protein